MPSRPYSPRIVGPVWPETSPEAWLENANGLNRKSAELRESAARIRGAVDELGSSNSGQMIDAMCERGYRTAQTIINQSDLYGDIASAVKETAELIWHARERLYEIDRRAHEDIERLRQQFAAAASPLGAGAASAALYAAIEAIINAAAAEALGVGTATAAAVAEQAAHIGGNPGGTAGSSGDHPALQSLSQQGESSRAEAMTDGTPIGTPPSNYGVNDAQSLGYGTEKQSPPDPSDVESGSDGVSRETPHGGSNAESNEHSGSEGNPATTASAEGAGAPSPPDPSSLENPYTATGTPTPMPAPMTPGGGGLSSTGGSSGGLRMPSAGLSGAGSVSPASGAGGLGSGGLNPAAAGLSPTSAGAGLPSAASAGTPTPPSDFSRGFNAGLASGGSVLPPPAQPANSTAGAYGPPSAGGAPSVPAGGGPVAQSAPPAAAGGSAAPAGPVGTPMVSPAPAPGGPLPSFNSDIAPRQASPASVSAPPGAPAASASSAAGGPGTPLPPGVVASGGAAAAAVAGAVAGAKSAAPDPLLADACALAEELMEASRQYGTIDWCVGVFKTPAKTLTVVTSGEGAGFIPAGVHLPKGVESLFSDSGLDNAFRRRWFGWINPAQTMVAYGKSLTALNPNIELWAVAVSTGFGGSAQPARAAGVPHYADCQMHTTDTPLGGGVMQPSLDETRLHRLQALNPSAYAQLNTATPVDVRKSLAITRQTANVTFTQASELLSLPIPPLLREIATHLDRGTAITEAQWDELASAVLPMAITDSSGQRPGRIGTDTEASSYARVQHNLARLAELLLLWRHGAPDHREVVYLAHHIAAERQLWVGHEDGGVR